MKKVTLTQLNVKSFITGAFNTEELKEIQGGKRPRKTHELS